jgi:hypothetical protein
MRRCKNRWNAPEGRKGEFGRPKPEVPAFSIGLRLRGRAHCGPGMLAKMTPRLAKGMAMALFLTASPFLANPVAAAPCNNGANANNCDVHYTKVTVLTNDIAAVGPVSVLNPASCSETEDGGCGYHGIGPTSMLQDADCASSGSNSCGDVGLGATTVAGDASCTAQNEASCGALGIGATSVAGRADCTSTSGSSCGRTGIGAVSVLGDASCTGDCGSLDRSSITSGGFGAVSVAGHASCDRPFHVNSPLGITSAQCIGGADVAGQLGVPP